MGVWTRAPDTVQCCTTVPDASGVFKSYLSAITDHFPKVVTLSCRKKLPNNALATTCGMTVFSSLPLDILCRETMISHSFPVSIFYKHIQQKRWKLWRALGRRWYRCFFQNDQRKSFYYLCSRKRNIKPLAVNWLGTKRMCGLCGNSFFLKWVQASSLKVTYNIYQYLTWGTGEFKEVAWTYQLKVTITK